MSDGRSQGRKISEFPRVTTLPANGDITLIEGNLNEKMSIADFLAEINVTGTFENIGDGLELYTLNGSVNEIRAIQTSGALTSRVGTSGSIEIDDGIVVQLTDGQNYTVLTDSEIVVGSVTGAPASNTVNMKVGAPVGSLVRVYVTTNSGTMQLNSSDASLITNETDHGAQYDLTGYETRSFRKITTGVWVSA